MARACQGPELMELMRQQAINFGTRMVTDDIVSVDFSRRPFRLNSLSGETSEAQCVIVATGARANYLGLPSEDALQESGRHRMCRVRRCVAAIPQQTAGGRRRRRFGRRGSDVPIEIRQPGLHGPSPRQVAGIADHGRTGAGESEDRDRLEPRHSTKCSATRKKASPPSACGARSTIARTSSRPPACFSPSGTLRTRHSSMASSS